ncbi:MAG: hypothetical protein EOP88_11170 [Verrucomicrobiaceae bacterium]|nr:MAG: hypothetical protein EOP88_11170 [Verrucomicrobiaceae bacterium]
MAKTYYCWRCKIPVPMLTDEEWAEVQPLVREDIGRIKEHRTATNMALPETIDTLRHESCERYFEITGVRERDPNVLYHHHLASHGRECPECGHLFRTPQASFCANCGFRPVD